MNKQYEIKKLRNQCKNLEDVLENMKDTIASLSRNNHNNNYEHEHNNYTHEDIKKLLEDGLTNEQICEKLGAKTFEVAGVKAHYTLGTYDSAKVRQRKLTEDEKNKIYRDLKKGMSTDDIADNYNITKIRAMGYLASYQRNLLRRKK